MAQKFATLNNGNGTGELDRKQFQHLFQFDEESLDILFEAFDIDHSGTLELSEMISGLSFMCRGTTEEKLKFLFDNCDSDHSGFLDNKEVLQMFDKLTKQCCSLEAAARRRGDTIQAKGPTTLDMKEKDVEAKEVHIERMKSHYVDLAKEFEKKGDLDGDGQVSYEEFELYMMNNELCKRFLDVMGSTAIKLQKDNLG